MRIKPSERRTRNFPAQVASRFSSGGSSVGAATRSSLVFLALFIITSKPSVVIQHTKYFFVLFSLLSLLGFFSLFRWYTTHTRTRKHAARKKNDGGRDGAGENPPPRNVFLSPRRCTKASPLPPPFHSSPHPQRRRRRWRRRRRTRWSCSPGRPFSVL